MYVKLRWCSPWVCFLLDPRFAVVPLTFVVPLCSVGIQILFIPGDDSLSRMTKVRKKQADKSDSVGWSIFRYICYIYYQKKLLNVGKHIYNMWILWGQLSHIGKSRPMSLWLFEVLCGGKRGVCFVAGRRWPIALMMLLLLMEENPANQLRLVVFPIIYKVLYIPGGYLRFLSHQQYLYYAIRWLLQNIFHFLLKLI